MPLVLLNTVTKKKYSYKWGTNTRNVSPFVLSIDEILNKYSHRILFGSKINCLISRIFNEDFVIISEPDILYTYPVVFLSNNSSAGPFDQFLDLTNLVLKMDIPNDYNVELVAFSIQNSKSTYTLFPHELRQDLKEEFGVLRPDDIKKLREASFTYETTSILNEVGLNQIAVELNNGNKRFQKGDYDGSIKCYRKVIEGYLNYFRQTGGNKKIIDDSENRTEKIIDYLKKVYSLLSNFGEHIGTRAFDEEGHFSHELVQSTSQYLIKKIEKMHNETE